MKVGEAVLFYTHEGSDKTHHTIDHFAIVLAVINDDILDVAVFPPGGPLRFERVYAFNEDGPLPPAGRSYWRGMGDDPPDFKELYAHTNDPAWAEMEGRHWREMRDAPGKDREALSTTHRKEQDELRSKLEKDQKEPDQGEDTLGEQRPQGNKPEQKQPENPNLNPQQPNPALNQREGYRA